MYSVSSDENLTCNCYTSCACLSVCIVEVFQMSNTGINEEGNKYWYNKKKQHIDIWMVDIILHKRKATEHGTELDWT